MEMAHALVVHVHWDADHFMVVAEFSERLSASRRQQWLTAFQKWSMTVGHPVSAQEAESILATATRATALRIDRSLTRYRMDCASPALGATIDDAPIDELILL